MPNLLTLIDKASEMCGGDAKLARRMGVAQSVISDMRHRGRTITPETAIELADIAGVNPLEAMADAVLERSKGTRREGVLREILGKALATGAAATLLISYSANANSETASTPKSETGLTKSLLYCRISTLFRAGSTLIRWAGYRLRSTYQHPQAGPETAA